MDLNNMMDLVGVPTYSMDGGEPKATNARALAEQNGVIIRINPNGSYELSHVNSSGFRHSKVYYGYNLKDAVINYVAFCIEEN